MKQLLVIGPFRRARAGLGPSPGWGPVRVGAHMAHIWVHIWALMGPPGQVLEDYVNFP